MKFISFIIFFFFSCAAQNFYTKNRPQWTFKGSHPSYPSSKYLIGFGSGKTLEDAENNARADLAKIFKVHVLQTTQSSEFYTQKGSEISHIFDIENITSSQTEFTLEGVQIAERHEDKENFYALAILDRYKSSEALKKQALQLSKQIKNIYEKAEKETIVFKKLSFLKMVLSNLLKLATINSQLIVLGQRKEVPLPFSIFKIEEEIISLSRELRFGLKIEGNSFQTLQSIIVEELTKNGFFISPKPPFHLFIDGNILIEKILRPPPEYEWAHYEITLKVKEGEEEKIVFEKNYKDDIGHRSFQQAEKRIFYIFKNKLIKDFIAELKKFLFFEEEI